MMIKSGAAAALAALLLAQPVFAQSAAPSGAETPASSAPATTAAQGSAVQSSSAEQSAAAAAAPAPKVITALNLPVPPAGKGQVIFFRKSSFQGMAVWFNVRENGNALGKLSNGAYFVQIVDPGTHTYTAATENKDTLKLEVDPDETYFVEGRVTMGIMIGEANISPSDVATFDKASKHLKLAPPPQEEKPTQTAAQ